MSLREILAAYPVAMISSICFYAGLALLLFQRTRLILATNLTFPVKPHQPVLGSLDTFRGAAAVLVALGHCWWATYPIFAQTQWKINILAYNTKAVPIFAVLSGFLIYRSLWSVDSIRSLRGYAIRRFFRIYPVYAAGVILSAVAGQYVGTPEYSSLSRFVADLCMFQTINWPGGFANPPTWSLYVEVVFYAFLPFIVLLISRERMVYFASAMICLLIAADSQSRVIGLWKFFCVGIIAAEALLPAKRLAFPLFVAGVALLFWDFGGPDHDWFADFGLTHRHGDGETIGLGLAAGLLLVSTPNLTLAVRVLDFLPFRILGTISYSLYIIHFFYLKANFREIRLFSQLGTSSMKLIWDTHPQFPWWYLPFVFFPGVLTWSVISFLLVEKPGVRLGKLVAARASGRQAVGLRTAELLSATRGILFKGEETRSDAPLPKRAARDLP